MPVKQLGNLIQGYSKDIFMLDFIKKKSGVGNPYPYIHFL